MKKLIFAVIAFSLLATGASASQRDHDPDRTLTGRALGALDGQKAQLFPYYPSFLTTKSKGKRLNAYERMRLNQYRAEHGDKNHR